VLCHLLLFDWSVAPCYSTTLPANISTVVWMLLTA
jgi:hypothetical protein